MLCLSVSISERLIQITIHGVPTSTQTLDKCRGLEPVVLSAGDHKSKSEHKKLQVVRWADTEQGNVELLAMKTLSETMLEGGASDTSPVEGGKKESVDGGKEELGALTANTFGFQGEAIKNEEKSSQVCTCTHQLCCLPVAVGECGHVCTSAGGVQWGRW